LADASTNYLKLLNPFEWRRNYSIIGAVEYVRDLNGAGVEACLGLTDRISVMDFYFPLSGRLTGNESPEECERFRNSLSLMRPGHKVEVGFKAGNYCRETRSVNGIVYLNNCTLIERLKAEREQRRGIDGLRSY
jgi:hypothetical protein